MTHIENIANSDNELYFVYHAFDARQKIQVHNNNNKMTNT